MSLYSLSNWEAEGRRSQLSDCLNTTQHLTDEGLAGLKRLLLSQVKVGEIPFPGFLSVPLSDPYVMQERGAFVVSAVACSMGAQCRDQISWLRWEFFAGLSGSFQELIWLRHLV